MINAQNTKIVQLAQPDAYAADTAHAVEIDTAGFAYCTVLVQMGLNDVQGPLVLCSLTEGDTSGSVTDAIASATIANASCVDVEGSATALANMDDGDSLVFHVDCRGRKRYLRLNCTQAASGASTFAAVAILSRESESAGALNADFVTPVTGLAKAIVI